jgi:quercetin dioxygenase-like cupin family protein
MADRFEDERGVIQDLLGQVDGVTEITTRAGHVRGNHVHPRTTQWVYVVSGQLLTSHAGEETIWPAGQMFKEPPAEPHAWRAVTDCTVLVFTKGPRSGEDYETDTIRLPREEWLLDPDLCGACHQPGSKRYPLTVISGGNRCHQVCPQP